MNYTNQELMQKLEAHKKTARLSKGELREIDAFIRDVKKGRKPDDRNKLKIKYYVSVMID